MRARLFVVLSALVFVTSFLLTGCSEESPPTSTADPRHAPASAVSGSHEDWCTEHEVPESMCTRCKGYQAYSCNRIR